MFFRPKGQIALQTDIHSHLIPGVDDGVKSIEESIEIILSFQKLGYQRLITTPHISESYYPNSVQKLKESFQEVVEELERRNIQMEIGLGAEYMVDGMLLSALKNKEELLTWNGYILIETSFQALPWILDEILFELQARKLVPILAHPERYPYFFEDHVKLEEMRNRGVKLQVNIGSLEGQYGPVPKKLARKLLSNGWVDFLGSDVHRIEHMKSLEKGLRSRTLNQLKGDVFLNNRLS
jgi:protein-tyrosine phosphatase